MGNKILAILDPQTAYNLEQNPSQRDKLFPKNKYEIIANDELENSGYKFKNGNKVLTIQEIQKNGNQVALPLEPHDNMYDFGNIDIYDYKLQIIRELLFFMGATDIKEVHAMSSSSSSKSKSNIGGKLDVSYRLHGGGISANRESQVSNKEANSMQQTGSFSVEPNSAKKSPQDLQKWIEAEHINTGMLPNQIRSALTTYREGGTLQAFEFEVSISKSIEEYQSTLSHLKGNLSVAGGLFKAELEGMLEQTTQYQKQENKHMKYIVKF
ncbi:hypothetical protein CQA53_01640 [Helicobacter didelphidarum]|uniref:Uncharacterized protein n=1 Tax=Helicobacter didelphidarum TaxID=2040648 RepID=A0A3D8IP44_9HELI|nr:hypothetical protein [Helicobacter didelphidarum]RDU66992.1 hypothetical protein CQA53_01640 [Helicobacter didelphidarum]